MSAAIRARALDGFSESASACHFGSPEHHAAFALLNLGVLGWLLCATSPHAPRLPQCLAYSGTASALVIHALLGSMCLSTEMRQYWMGMHTPVFYDQVHAAPSGLLPQSCDPRTDHRMHSGTLRVPT